MTPSSSFYEIGAGATVCIDPGNCANGGPTNENPVHPAFMGSPRFYTNGADPGSSFEGGLLRLVVFDPVGGQVALATINGTIDMSGVYGNQNFGTYCDGGGGAGGAILIETSRSMERGCSRPLAARRNWAAAGVESVPGRKLRFLPRVDFHFGGKAILPDKTERSLSRRPPSAATRV